MDAVEDGGLSAMIVLLLKQMHLQKDVAVDLAAVVRFRRNRKRNVMVIVGDIEGRIVR